MPEKYEKPPNPSEANYIIFSMVEFLSELRDVVEHFPSHSDKKQRVTVYGPFQVARATTVAWSGSRGNNVPIAPWCGYQIGFVIDPNKVDVPYADFVASASYDVVLDEEYVIEKSDSKYAGKKQLLRPWDRSNQAITNQAVLRKLPRLEEAQANCEILEAGDVNVFAENVWRKYFKSNITATNEALCIQKNGETNPVLGIFLDVSFDSAELDEIVPATHHDEDRQELIAILQKKPHLKLYIYDTRQEEHIVRVVENERAAELLASNCDFSKEYVGTLLPYNPNVEKIKSEELAQSKCSPKSVTKLNDVENFLNSSRGRRMHKHEK